MMHSDNEVPRQEPVIFPPGLVGKTAQFIFNAAPYPNRHIALAGALAMFAGICGRSYNVMGAGLNLYIILMGLTGIGKEAANSGISRLISSISSVPESGATTGGVPAASDFLGPGYIASFQALQKQLVRTPCFLSIVGEAGLKLDELTSPKASPNSKLLVAGFMDLYSKSGQGNVVHPMIYSDKEKDSPAIKTPSLSLLLEGTPSTLAPALSEASLRNGLLPRFIIINAGNRRSMYNEWAASMRPDAELVQSLADICAMSLSAAQAGTVRDVQLDVPAKAYLIEFRSKLDDRIDKSNDGAERDLLSRVTLNVLKVASLVAVGENPHLPTISLPTLKAAFQLVHGEVSKMLAMIDNGETGVEAGNQTKQWNEAVRIIKHYIMSDWPTVKPYHGNEALHKKGVITFAYLQQRLSPLAAFKNDRIEAKAAVERVVKSLVDADYIREVPKQQMRQDFNGNCPRAYIPSEMMLETFQ